MERTPPREDPMWNSTYPEKPSWSGTVSKKQVEKSFAS